MNYERAKQLFREHLKDGWTIDAAVNDASISYPLTLKEQENLWRYAKRYQGA